MSAAILLMPSPLGAALPINCRFKGRRLTPTPHRPARLPPAQGVEIVGRLNQPNSGVTSPIITWPSSLLGHFFETEGGRVRRVPDRRFPGAARASRAIWAPQRALAVGLSRGRRVAQAPKRQRGPDHENDQSSINVPRKHTGAPIHRVRAMTSLTPGSLRFRLNG